MMVGGIGTASMFTATASMASFQAQKKANVENRFMWNPTKENLDNIIKDNANYGGQNMQNAINGK